VALSLSALALSLSVLSVLSVSVIWLAALVVAAKEQESVILESQSELQPAEQ
jgi:hypothetical protein